MSQSGWFPASITQSPQIDDDKVGNPPVHHSQTGRRAAPEKCSPAKMFQILVCAGCVYDDGSMIYKSDHCSAKSRKIASHA